MNVIDVPVLDLDHHYYFMIRARLQTFMTSIYNKPEEKSYYSFREYLKRKIKWSDFEDLYYEYSSDA